MKRINVFAAAALLAGCAQSPLYDSPHVAGGTRDEVPRDGNGEPMLAAVRPAVPSQAPPPMPPLSMPQ